MSTTVKFLWLVLFVAFLSGLVALATWGIPVPSRDVTKTISVQKFIKFPGDKK